MRLRVTSAAATEDRPLLDLLPDLPDDRRMAFVRADEGLVAWGVAARLEPGAGDGRFDRADALLRDLAASADVRDEVSLPGSGLVAFGSFDFDGGARGSTLLVPRVVIGRHDGVTWRTEIDPLDAPTAPALAGALTSAEDTGDGLDDGDRRARFAGSTIADAAWLEGVEAAVAAIAAGDIEKVVLARDQRVWARRPFDTSSLLRRLATTFPSCTTFLVDHLLGASPETLLALHHREIRSLVLAGTARRGATDAEDALLGEGLLTSAKDRAEHDLAVRSVVEVLARHCDSLEADPDPTLLRLDNVQHLATRVTGTTTADRRSLALVGALHPTAAVGGVPRERALGTVRRLEGMDRDRYAAPVGWTDAAGDGEWAIALRCALVDGDRARLFAGAGIVAGSLPEDELLETWHKLGAMRGALGLG